MKCNTCIVDLCIVFSDDCSYVREPKHAEYVECRIINSLNIRYFVLPYFTLFPFYFTIVPSPFHLICITFRHLLKSFFMVQRTCFQACTCFQGNHVYNQSIINQGLLNINYLWHLQATSLYVNCGIL